MVSLLSAISDAENALATMFGLPAVLVGRASHALEVILRNHRPGSVVALSPIVCQDVIAAVLAAGCTPYFIDLDAESGQVPIEEWKSARDAGATVAIIVHLFGNPSDVSSVRSIFPAPECLVVDDAAQALGSHWEGTLAGTGGDVGLLSFGYSKQLETGGAAVLCADPLIVTSVKQLRVTSAKSAEREAQKARDVFRERFELARLQLYTDGRESASAFRGLLDGYAPALHHALELESAKRLTSVMPNLERVLAARREKAALWSVLLKDSPLVPVGRDDGTVPWRYACRLPGSHWKDQARIAETLRARGIPVSTWYLPGQWYVHGEKRKLAGAERFSAEVFQFWVDTTIEKQEIVQQSAMIREVLASLGYAS